MGTLRVTTREENINSNNFKRSVNPNTIIQS